MAKKVFKANLSVSSIRQLQKDLKEYKNSLEYKCKLLSEKLAERGVEIAKIRISSLDAVFTGELINSIHSEDKGYENKKAIFIIVTNNEHAAFVEFGTGIIGQDSPYPYELPEGVAWEYATGETIRQLADGRYGWFYPRDGKWYFTQGMPARPFMFETSLELQKIIVDVAKEIFEQ